MVGLRGGFVSRLRVVAGFVMGVLGLAFVGDLSLVSVVVVGHVVDGLDAAVRQGYGVRARDGLAIRVLRVAEVGARVVVPDAVVEGVGLGLLVRRGRGKRVTGKKYRGTKIKNR